MCVYISLSRNRNNQNDQSKGITRREKRRTPPPLPLLLRLTPRLYWRKKDSIKTSSSSTEGQSPGNKVIKELRLREKKACPSLLLHCALFMLLLVRVSMLYLTGRAVSRLANHVEAAQPRATNQNGEFLFKRCERRERNRGIYLGRDGGLFSCFC